MGSDTIFALATATGRAAIAIIRISGPQSRSVLAHVAGRVPEPRVATLATLINPKDQRVLDRALVIWFPAPNSFTGQDSAEIHLHGGRAVIEAVLSVLSMLPGCRLAEPGEFTRRALLNDKLDLAEVEGLADLIDAQTEGQRRQALRLLDGALGRWVEVQRGLLLQALAAAESAIDFADEGDVSGSFDAEIQTIAGRLLAEIASLLASGATAERVRDGLVVALVGPPNAGKSTLLNALARRDAAIVSPHAGTTRDPIEVQLDLDGQLVICIDTAGLRDSIDPVEQEGVARARARAASADLVLWLQDAREPIRPDPALDPSRLWRVATKSDLAGQDACEADFTIAAPAGTGLPELVAAIQRLGHLGGDTSGLVTRQRHRRALAQAHDALAPLAEGGLGIELMAERLRGAARALDSLVGHIGNEDVLGEIFARFCIGK